MPGFLGGSTGGSSGTGGEISFPKEFIDPVTKLRVSQPENLIDTDFEYGLQPTKWETVELINNTPSFFSKSGDTTIPNIISITTNAGTREITVVTALEHGVSVGIPISVTGTKSITADGAYIINSIPNTTTFTYLCKANQPTTSSIEDLYSSIITGEFFQGSQLRVADASGIVTDNEEGTSTLTVTTDSAHGFKTNTPFYFLNLNSTISKDFQASNTAAKSFDSTNSAVAQTFDGSNTLSSINIDWSNSATVGGVVSNISTVSTLNNTFTVAHSTENFSGRPLGTPLYYSVTGGAGYFATNPRGVVFLKSTTNLGTSTSTFQVSAVPDGEVIAITALPSGTFQLANQARTFSGNNVNPLTQIDLTVQRDAEFVFDGGNQGFAGAETNGVCTVEGYAGTILVSTGAGLGLDYYVGAMVRYNTSGTAASGLTNTHTYFIASFTTTATPNQYRITLKNLPTDASALAPTGGTGDQTFTKIGVSLDKNIVHVKNSNFSKADLVQYEFPVGGRFGTGTSDTKLFYFVETVYDAHNYTLSPQSFVPMTATGGQSVSQIVDEGRTWNVHTYTTVGTSSFVVSEAGSSSGLVEYLVVAGGGGGARYYAGGGGAGGFRTGSLNLTAGTYTVTVGAGGLGGVGSGVSDPGKVGGNSVFSTITSLGGAGGSPESTSASPKNGGSGGGGGAENATHGVAGLGTAGQGFAGGAGSNNNIYRGGGGGGAGGVGDTGNSTGNGGLGAFSAITGVRRGYAGGGGGGTYMGNGSDGIGFAIGGFGGGSGAWDGLAVAGLANTGGGGGAGGGIGNGPISNSNGNAGGSGVVIVRYPLTEAPASVTPMTASGGIETTITVGAGAAATQYKVHSFTTVGTTNFVIGASGNINNGRVEYLIVAGGGGGGSENGGVGGGGGGAGGVITGSITPATGTYPVVVGNGGAGGAYPGSGTAANGGNSSVFSLTALGGGGGANQDTAGASGGSGGGGGASPNNTGGAGGGANAAQGNIGGIGGNVSNSTGYKAGGGGGAGFRGQDQREARRNWCGRGGIGMASDIRTGSVAYYAGGGGGGGIWSGWSESVNGGAGGLGGGGKGGDVPAGRGAPGDLGTAGTDNTGGGGGGGAYLRQGANGGSGIVVIRYPIGLRAG